MTQQNENVSAMLDGEALVDTDTKALTNDIISDPVLKAKWQSFHLTRDLLRNDISSDHQFDVSKQIAEALENELSIVAPKKTWRELPVVSSVIPLVKQSGQLAMVACVTAVVIFGYQSFNQPEKSSPLQTAPSLIGPQGGMSPVSLQTTSAQSISDNERYQFRQMLEQQRHINTLLQDHERQRQLKVIGSDAIQDDLDREDQASNN